MEEKELYRLKAFLKRSKIRKKTLELLYEEQPMTPTEMAAELEMQQPNLSNRLKDLREEELVEVLNPEDNRDRFYKITAKGRELLDNF